MKSDSAVTTPSLASDSLMLRIATRLRPDVEIMSPPERMGAVTDIFTLLWTVPLALVGLIWLIAATNLTLVQRELPILIILLVLGIIFQRLSFSLELELRRGTYAHVGGSLVTLVHWSAALLFGPTALWLPVLEDILATAYQLGREYDPNLRWNKIRALSSSIAGETLSGLAGLWVYVQLGGSFPLGDLGWQDFWPALVASLVVWLVLVALSAVILFYIVRQQSALLGNNETSAQLMQFFASGMSFFVPIYPFAILAAGLYSQHGVGIYLLFVLGALMFNLLANRLSHSLRVSDQRERELARLEKLGEALIKLHPPDTLARLPDLLDEFVIPMLPHARVTIWLEPDQLLLQTPAGNPPHWEETRAAVVGNSAEFYTFPELLLPGQRAFTVTHDSLAVPIRAEDGDVLGGIFVLQRRDQGRVLDFIPALQSLASQIGIALGRVQTYQQRIQGERMSRELELAGHIQASFLPHDVPQPPGYQIAATIVPARETSGDFYDFIPFDDGRLGILVADVADKGTGAALYMALSRTLLRTYAMQFPDDPARVLTETNARLMTDTQSDQFVTVFYGVVDPASGTFVYCNGGHNPAYLLSPDGSTQAFKRTGIPLGMFDTAPWQTASTTLPPGSALLLYTDGVPEAQNKARELFEDARLLSAVTRPPTSAETVKQEIVSAVVDFVGDAPQFDDITLLVVLRDA